MDRNQFIGLILMLVMLTVYFQFFSPEIPEQPIPDNVPAATITQADGATDSLNTTSANAGTFTTLLSDSAKDKLMEMKYGAFAPVAAGIEEIIIIETEKLTVSFSNKGGAIKKVVLPEYTAFDGSDLDLFNEGHALGIYFDHLSRRINLNDLYFQSSQKKYSDSTEIRYRLVVNGATLDQIYTVYKGKYEVGYRLESNGFEKQIEAKNINFSWAAKLNRLEKDLTDSRSRTTVHYYTSAGETDYLSKRATGHEELTLSEPVKWISFNQKFFTSAVIADKSFANGFITMDVPADSNVVKFTTMQAEIPYTDLASGLVNFKYFFGPNRYYELKDVADGFSINLELGWFFLPWINKYLVIPIFTFLEMFFDNYGIIIILMVIIIRIILSPLTYKSHMSMAKMKVLKPELDAIKERNGDDMQKAQSEQMDLYRKAGINPLSGCIPVLLQFPILVSLFYFIPSAIELRLESFLWADDMSTYDSIFTLPFNIPFYGSHVSLFTLLMAASTVLYTFANSQMTTIQGPMKTMQYIMPVMLLFFFNSFPAGLSYYYFISNVVSYGQIFIFRKLVDEDKIKLIMEENKKKNANKKKSSFQLRLEEAMKASQEAQKKNKKK